MTFGRLLGGAGSLLFAKHVLPSAGRPAWPSWTTMNISSAQMGHARSSRPREARARSALSSGWARAEATTERSISHEPRRRGLDIRWVDPVGAATETAASEAASPSGLDVEAAFRWRFGSPGTARTREAQPSRVRVAERHAPHDERPAPQRQLPSRALELSVSALPLDRGGKRRQILSTAYDILFAHTPKRPPTWRLGLSAR